MKPDGEVFYVGKGSGNRITFTSNRNAYWKRINDKYGFIPFVIEDGLSEEVSYEREVYWIAHYKKMGQCKANFSVGGVGINIEKRWWGKAISKALKGRKLKRGEESKSYKDLISKDDLYHYYVTMKMSSTSIQRLSGLSYTTLISRLRKYGIPVRKAGREERSVVCLDDGLVFESVKKTADHYNVFPANIRKVINGKYKTTGGKRFAYVNDDRQANRGSI